MDEKREALHKAIDKLTADQLFELETFIEFLQFKASQSRYSQNPDSSALRERGVFSIYQASADEPDEFIWLKKLPAELKTEFLIDLIETAQWSKEAHYRIEIPRLIEQWKARAEGKPLYNPVDFQEGIGDDFDLSLEDLKEARKEIWAGFGDWENIK